MLPLEQLCLNDSDWQRLCEILKATVPLSTLVVAAWQMGLWLARAIVEQQLQERATAPFNWGNCSVCQSRLISKGWIKRQMLTLVGQVEWKRRVGRCPHQCPSSQQIPFDVILDIHAYQQTSTELLRLGCLLAVFMPFNLAVEMLQQLTGLTVSDSTLWEWVQDTG